MAKFHQIWSHCSNKVWPGLAKFTLLTKIWKSLVIFWIYLAQNFYAIGQILCIVPKWPNVVKQMSHPVTLQSYGRLTNCLRQRGNETLKNKIKRWTGVGVGVSMEGTGKRLFWSQHGSRKPVLKMSTIFRTQNSLSSILSGPRNKITRCYIFCATKVAHQSRPVWSDWMIYRHLGNF